MIPANFVSMELITVTINMLSSSTGRRDDEEC